MGKRRTCLDPKHMIRHMDLTTCPICGGEILRFQPADEDLDMTEARVRPEFAPRQIVVVHESVWEELGEWARRHQMALTRMPTGDDGLPTYCFTMTGK